jgi:hypothetical protein
MWKPTEACPQCGVIYAKYGVPVSPTPRPAAPKPVSTAGSWLARNRRAVLTHAAVGIASLLVGFYAGQLYLQVKIVNAVSEAFGGVAKSLGGEAPREAPVPTPPRKVEAVESPIVATLMSKTFREQDFSGSEMISAAVTFSVDFENKGTKGIRAFDGKLTFTDLLDNEILSAGVSVSDMIASGATYRWNGELEYNQFMDKHKRLRAQAAEDMRVVFKPGKFLYTDGSRSDQ